MVAARSPTTSILSSARWQAIAIGAAVIFVLAALLAALLPPSYRSSATILIQEQEIPQELVRSTITSFADERIQVISQEVLARSVLLELIGKIQSVRQSAALSDQ